MSRDREPMSQHLSTENAAGPYRAPAPRDPGVAAAIGAALASARRAAGRAASTERRLLRLAVGGYLAASLAASPGSEDAGGKPRTVAWTCMAAGATCAIFLAGRAGARARELQAEITGIERLASALSRLPGGT